MSAKFHSGFTVLGNRWSPRFLHPDRRRPQPLGADCWSRGIPVGGHTDIRHCSPSGTGSDRSRSIALRTDVDDGDHFAALEQPELLVQDIRAVVDGLS